MVVKIRLPNTPFGNFKRLFDDYSGEKKHILWKVKGHARFNLHRN